MIERKEILETIEMVRAEHLDVRCITMGLSLFDCVGSPDKVYEKIARSAENLVGVGEKIAAMYGVPVVNKRVSVSPISLIGGGTTDKDEYIKYAIAMDRAAKATGVDLIGGYSALVYKGITDYERAFIESIPEALAVTDKVCSSVAVASSRAGINMDAVKLMGRIVKACAERTADHDSIGATKLVVFANPVEDNPFMAGAFNGVGEADKVINVGVSGPGVVKTALEKVKDADLTEIAEVIKKTAFKVTRVGQLVAQTASKMLDAKFGIVDLSLAPTPAVGDSVARILEEIGLTHVGSCGTTACLMMLNDAVKKGGFMASSHVGGLSGAFIPVSEDEGMIEAATSGALTIEKLEAMTAVCSVGLDMIAVAGDTPPEVISAVIADESAIGVVNHKTTAVRLVPVIGKSVGDVVNFGGLFGYAPIMPLSKESPLKFINRGGRIPAPITGNKN